MAKRTVSLLLEDTRLLNDNVDSTQVSDVKLTRWINDVYRFVCLPNNVRHPELWGDEVVSFVAGTRTYSIPTFTIAAVASGDNEHPFIIIENVVSQEVANTDRTLRLKPSTYYAQADRPVTNGPPTNWSRFGNSIIVDPEPQDTLRQMRVQGWVEAADLSGADTILIREQWDEIVVTGAGWRLARYLGNHERAEILKSDYVDLFNAQTDVIQRELQAPGPEMAVDQENFSMSGRPSF